jgi:phosphatidylserine/phosphatidylglycerophosphate/cardiolipin synthase-like enzyme
MNSEAPYNLRRIFKSSTTGSGVVKELVQLMVLVEMLNPSEEIWIVSPWISDISILDNRSGSFDVLNPEWHRREIRLSDLSLQILTGGSRIVIVTRPDEHNLTFLNVLREKVNEASLGDLLTIITREHLHTKGILTGSGLLLGSMNLTYRGFELNDEVIEYDTSNQRLAVARQSFIAYREESSNG